MSTKDDPQKVHFSQEELQMAFSESNRLGKPIMAHAHSSQAIKEAVKAGARSIEHGSFIDEEGIQLMISNGTFLVPTLYIGEHFEKHGNSSGPLQKMLEIQKKNKRFFFELHKKSYIKRCENCYWD